MQWQLYYLCHYHYHHLQIQLRWHYRLVKTAHPSTSWCSASSTASKRIRTTSYLICTTATTATAGEIDITTGTASTGTASIRSITSATTASSSARRAKCRARTRG